jgi:hypothetical protein
VSHQADSYVVTVSARLAAPSERVYSVIADYHRGHPRILPKQFTGLTVEKGGVGEGTVIRVSMRVFGRRFEFRGFVTEPEPGRVLVERNVGENESVTSFTVDPGATAQQAVVTIATELRRKPGLLGAIERFFTTRTLRAMYGQELSLLEAAAIMRPVANEAR